MDDPGSGNSLSHPGLLHESLLGAKQLHRQPVVCWAENLLQLVFHPTRLELAVHRSSEKRNFMNGSHYYSNTTNKTKNYPPTFKENKLRLKLCQAQVLLRLRLGLGSRLRLEMRLGMRLRCSLDGVKMLFRSGVGGLED